MLPAVFDGLDDIDWASLGHAYGSAEDVPAWVRGLAGPDPAVREESLDALCGAVHDQGDVYDSTLAVVPYLLEVLTMPGLPGRAGIAELITGIVRLDDWPDESELDDDQAEMYRHAIRVNALTAATAPDLLRLLDDPEPEVRVASAKLLTVLVPAVPGLSGLLLDLLGAEADGAVRTGLFEALGGLRLDEDAIGRLLGLTRSARASTALAALIAVARNDPYRVPLDGVPELIGRAYAEDGPAPEEHDEGRRAPHCSRMIEELTDPLGPRVAQRIAIVDPLLASPHDDLAGDALYAANKMINSWRGDYRETVTRIAGFLDRSPQLAGQAASMLRYWGPVAAPAAEPVARRLAALAARPWRAGLPEWAVPYGNNPPELHPYLEILSGLGDERALPLLLTALTLPRRPTTVGYRLAGYPGHADRITSEILPHFPVPVAGEHTPLEWYGFQVAFRAFGAAAGPAVPRLLASPLQDWSAVTLGRIGPAAAPALPALRQAATGDDPQLAVAAAGALWRIDRSPDALALLTNRLDGPAAGEAFEEIGAMGPAADPAAALVATYLDAPPGDWRTPVRAAVALWQLTGDAERVTPALTAAWHGNRLTRLLIAEAATGSLAAALQPLFSAEIAANLRFNVSAGSWSSAQVIEDERLRELCRADPAARVASPA
jgi:hypothetical protein